MILKNRVSFLELFMLAGGCCTSCIFISPADEKMATVTLSGTPGAKITTGYAILPIKFRGSSILGARASRPQ